MKYSVVSCINGNFKVEAECGENKQQAFTVFHTKYTAFWNASDVVTGMVTVLDENLNTVDNKKEFISHPIVDAGTE